MSSSHGTESVAPSAADRPVASEVEPSGFRGFFMCLKQCLQRQGAKHGESTSVFTRVFYFIVLLISFRPFQLIVYLISGEWILDLTRGCNGGTIVLLRSLCFSMGSFCIILIFQNIINHGLNLQILHLSVPTPALYKAEAQFGALFAGSYATFYARFASQWTYLSGVYNQIKAAQSRKDRCDENISQWKAGFIEDAYYLHLYRKVMFAAAVHSWLKDPKVEKFVKSDAPRLERKLGRIKKRVKKACGQNS